jgi:hypothetical protein
MSPFVYGNISYGATTHTPQPGGTLVMPKIHITLQGRLTLTQWYQKFDEETRRLARALGQDYPAELDKNYDKIKVELEDSPWIAAYKIASLGSLIESNRIAAGRYHFRERIETATEKLVHITNKNTQSCGKPDSGAHQSSTQSQFAGQRRLRHSSATN